MDVLGIDHIYLTVSDFERSCAFYDKAMKVFGFHKGDMAIAGQPHAHYFNRTIQISIRPAGDEVVRRWEEFDTFLNPMAAKGKDHE